MEHQRIRETRLAAATMECEQGHYQQTRMGVSSVRRSASSFRRFVRRFSGVRSVSASSSPSQAERAALHDAGSDDVGELRWALAANVAVEPAYSPL
jgi:hypothetical protein